MLTYERLTTKILEHANLANVAHMADGIVIRNRTETWVLTPRVQGLNQIIFYQKRDWTCGLPNRSQLVDATTRSTS